MIDQIAAVLREHGEQLEKIGGEEREKNTGAIEPVIEQRLGQELVKIADKLSPQSS